MVLGGGRERGRREGQEGWNSTGETTGINHTREKGLGRICIREFLEKKKIFTFL